MQTTLFEIKFYDGSKFNVFCANSSQINRFLKFINKHKDNIEYWKDSINGIHKITQFEKITTNFLNSKKMECYIDYLDCKNKFKQTRKEFKTYELAKKWMLKTFEKPNIDFIKFN